MIVLFRELPSSCLSIFRDGKRGRVLDASGAGIEGPGEGSAPLDFTLAGLKEKLKAEGIVMALKYSAVRMRGSFGRLKEKPFGAGGGLGPGFVA